MQASPIKATPTPASAALSDRQRYRLDTVNLIFKSLSVGVLAVFGEGETASRLELKRLGGGFCFVSSRIGTRPVDLEGPVYGKERLLPGFNGNSAEQRLLRSLVAFVRDGQRVGAATLLQAFMASGNFDQVEADYNRVMDEFRFAGAFNKPVPIDPKTGKAA